MNILFLTMNVFTDIEMHNIYSDLMKEFIKHGHRPYIATPREKKLREETELIDFENYSILKVQIGNTSNVSLIEKGISTVTLSSRFYRAVKNKLGDLSFGLILYSTPPITLVGPVKKLKRRFGCRTYLMLKDIFPQNAVDLGMFSKTSLIYKYFRHQEKEFYKVSDMIGCMSPANVEYVLKNNVDIKPEKVEICPNAIIPHERVDCTGDKLNIRQKYSIPEEAIVYLYGGNLGKPQGIPFLVDCLRENMSFNDRYFIICGTGSEFHLIQEFIEEQKPRNVKLIDFLPKEEYDRMVRGCDVGLIFLDHRFTIPNYPSRLLSYMEYGMPVLSCTDNISDIRKTISDGKFGWSCTSDDVHRFTDCINEISCKKDEIPIMGENARKYLVDKFQATIAYEIICCNARGEKDGRK